MCQNDYTTHSRNGKHRTTIKKRKEGRTISNRPEEADDRSKLGHWEMGLVEGSKEKMNLTY